MNQCAWVGDSAAVCPGQPVAGPHSAGRGMGAGEAEASEQTSDLLGPNKFDFTASNKSER